MQIDDKAAIGIFSVIAGWLISVFTQGRRVGKIEAKVEARLDAVEVKVAKNEVETAALRAHHDDDLRQMRNFFSTSTGGQKFITFPDHDGICERNNKLTLQAVSHLTEVIQQNTAQVAEMGNQIHRLQVTVAVLKERRHEGQRQDTNHEATIR